MSPKYVQKCICRGRVVSALRDIEHYTDELVDRRASLANITSELTAATALAATDFSPELGRDIRELLRDRRTLEHEAALLMGKIARAQARSFSLGGTCSICGDTGVVTGNGCAQTGGNGRAGGLGIAA